jgi:hypothetical protein
MVRQCWKYGEINVVLWLLRKPEAITWVTVDNLKWNFRQSVMDMHLIATTFCNRPSESLLKKLAKHKFLTIYWRTSEICRVPGVVLGKGGYLIRNSSPIFHSVRIRIEAVQLFIIILTYHERRRGGERDSLLLKANFRLLHKSVESISSDTDIF